MIAVALLAGWQAALVHPLQHFDEYGALVHLDAPQGQPSSKGDQLCDALAALTACSPGAQLAFDAPAADRPSTVSPDTGWRVPEAPPFHSQAPPSVV